jgi:DNA-binding protein HU-beta
VTKQEFVENLALRCEFSKAEAGRAVDAILDSLTAVMADGEEVSFIGFGKFLSRRRRARDAVNPQDPSKKIRVRAAHVPKFKPGTTLREAVAQLSGNESLAAGNGGRRPATSAAGGTVAPTGATASSSGAGERPQWRPLGER